MMVMQPELDAEPSSYPNRNRNPSPSPNPNPNRNPGPGPSPNPNPNTIPTPTPSPDQADFDAELLRGSAAGGAQQKGQRPKRAAGVTTAATRGGSRARTARVLPEYEIELPDE